MYMCHKMTPVLFSNIRVRWKCGYFMSGFPWCLPFLTATFSANLLLVSWIRPFRRINVTSDLCFSSHKKAWWKHEVSFPSNLESNYDFEPWRSLMDFLDPLSAFKRSYWHPWTIVSESQYRSPTMRGFIFQDSNETFNSFELLSQTKPLKKSKKKPKKKANFIWNDGEILLLTPPPPPQNNPTMEIRQKWILQPAMTK